MFKTITSTMIKPFISTIKRVVNKDRHRLADEHHFWITANNDAGQVKFYAFTEEQLKVAEDRAKSNMEDAPVMLKKMI